MWGIGPNVVIYANGSRKSGAVGRAQPAYRMGPFRELNLLLLGLESGGVGPPALF